MVSIAELRSAGTRLEPDEAVAIVQQLINRLRPRRIVDGFDPPHEPPSAANVFLHDDGSVSCRDCGSAPTLAGVGIFLHTLLPAGSSRVAGSLRYAIACAMLTVDVVPFDPLGAFSRDLAPHALGDRAAIVRRLLARSGAVRPVRPYFTMPSRPAMAAAAACCAAGLALVAAGVTLRREPIAATPTVPIAATGPIAAPMRAAIVLASRSPRSPSSRPTSPRLGRGLIVVHEIYSEAGAEPRAGTVERSKGVIDRLRLGWLRNALSHSDL